MKLHLGCGNYHLEGYTNIDIVAMKGVDVVCDATDILSHWPAWEGTVEEILSFHTFEHFTQKQAIKALWQWYKLLIPGGRLVLELPDLQKLCLMVAAGETDDLTLAYIFGPQDRTGQNHLWGWSFDTLTNALQLCGFSKIQFKEPMDYHAKERPCMRMEAIK